MSPEIIKLRKQLDKIYEKIKGIQSKCKHLNFDSEYGSNTGNYDPSSDCYWIDVDCLDCGKHMSFDSCDDRLNYLKYGKSR